MKRIATVLVFLMVAIFATAITPAEISEAETLIESNQSCNNLSADQLELLGEYVMEQMHPGTAHEFMHKMMGLEESSKVEERFHIALATRAYCHQETTGFGGMMPMMGYWTNGLARQKGGSWMPYYGMMDYAWGWGLNGILVTVLLLGLTVAVFLWIVKLWREIHEKRK